MTSILKQLQMQKQLTQLGLARALNISQAAISRYERGVCEPELSVIIAMTDFFEISMDKLVRGLYKQNESFRTGQK